MQDDVDLRIPWDMIAPHEEQAELNHGQTLARLAERGGLSLAEAIAVLEDRRWSPMNEATAIAQLETLVIAWAKRNDQPGESNP